jgi:hypothetical protein
MVIKYFKLDEVILKHLSRPQVARFSSLEVAFMM